MKTPHQLTEGLSLLPGVIEYTQVKQNINRDVWQATVNPAGGTINIRGVYSNQVGGPRPFNRTFRVGEKAEIDSWNVAYIGTIEKITATYVEMSQQGYTKRKRLHLAEFTWRNWNFDLATIVRQQREHLD